MAMFLAQKMSMTALVLSSPSPQRKRPLRPKHLMSADKVASSRKRKCEDSEEFEEPSFADKENRPNPCLHRDFDGEVDYSTDSNGGDSDEDSQIVGMTPLHVSCTPSYNHYFLCGYLQLVKAVDSNRFIRDWGSNAAESDVEEDTKNPSARETKFDVYYRYKIINRNDPEYKINNKNNNKATIFEMLGERSFDSDQPLTVSSLGFYLGLARPDAIAPPGSLLFNSMIWESY